MTHAGNILGFGLGMINLAESKALSWVPGGQFSRLSVLGCVVLMLSVTITCFSTPEVEPGRSRQSNAPRGRIARLSSAVASIANAIKTLPLPIRRICFVQVRSAFERMK